MPSREWWEDFNLPYEANPEAVYTTQDDTIMAGAFTVLAAVIDGGEMGKFPALQFRFVNAIGEFLHPVTLVLDATTMAKVPGIVGDAVAAAIKESKA